MRGLPLVLIALTALVPSAFADNPTLSPDGKGWRVKAPGYEAAVGEDGCFTRLCVGGAEFVTAAAGFPRGGYFYQDGLLTLPQVERLAPNALLAKSEKASARYEFAADRITWSLTNTTTKRMLFVVVVDPAVGAMADDRGRFRKAPLERQCASSAWFLGKSKVRLTGTTRVWGPWNGKHQVWEIALNPKETRNVTLEPGTATDAEAAQAQAAATAPPPPPPADPIGPMWDMEKLSKPPATFPAPGIEAPGVKALFFEGPPVDGRPTRVFAWVGLPKVEPGRKVPGMVLVHGGGGTAFAEWVRLWTGRGYAAIAMDTCGCVPKGSYGNWQRQPEGGPAGWGGFNQIDEPREEQWTYHAVADAILAHSLLRSLPEVDPERIGLTGISWGGYLTCILAGVDHRFRFAVPVYGCGFTTEMAFAGSVTGLGKERGERWMRWWDPSVYLKDAPMPMLWVDGTNDFAYTFNALQKSYRLPKGPRTLCVRIRMPHGHGGPGENPEEIHAFADTFCKGGEPLARITGQGREGAQVWATYESKLPVTRAELNITRDGGKWQDRKWEALPAAVEPGGKVTASLPEGVKVYYLNLIDSRGLIVSSEHVGE